MHTISKYVLNAKSSNLYGYQTPPPPSSKCTPPDTYPEDINPPVTYPLDISAPSRGLIPPSLGHLPPRTYTPPDFEMPYLVHASCVDYTLH